MHDYFVFHNGWWGRREDHHMYYGALFKGGGGIQNDKMFITHSSVGHPSLLCDCQTARMVTQCSLQL